MKVTKILALTALMALTTSVCSSAMADMSNKTLTFGLEEGPGFLTGSGGTHLQWGGEVLYNLLGPIEIGGYLNYMSLGTLVDPDNGNQLTGNYLFYGGTVLYDLNAWLPNSSLGARIGLLHNSVTKTFNGGADEADNTTNFSVGPIFNYDIPLSSNFSVGGLANIQFNTGSAHSDIAILATLKYYL